MRSGTLRCSLGAAACLLGAGCGSRTPLLLGPFAEATDGGAVDSGRADGSVRADSGPGVDGGVDGTRPPQDAASDAPPPVPDAQIFLAIPNAPSAPDSTWAWTGAAWAPVAVATAPPQRTSTALASDGQELVLFGGLDENNNELADTWLFANGAWSQAFPSSSPSARAGHSMTEVGNTVILFGGVGPSENTLDDTWIWDGTTWMQPNLHRGAPPPRSLAAFGTLGGDGTTAVLFGGSDGTGNSLADTWVWDGVWSNVSSAMTPPPSFGQLLAPLGNGVVLFVPDFNDNITLTWRFDGTSWTADPVPAAPAPALFGFGSAGPGSAPGSVLLYGGYAGSTGDPQDHTYTWDGTVWTDLGPSAGPSTFASGSTPCLMAPIP